MVQKVCLAVSKSAIYSASVEDSTILHCLWVSHAMVHTGIDWTTVQRMDIKGRHL